MFKRITIVGLSVVMFLPSIYDGSKAYADTVNNGTLMQYFEWYARMMEIIGIVCVLMLKI